MDDGAINGEVFVAYIRQQLVPTTRPGDVGVTDNLARHKRQGFHGAIEAVGRRLLHLPPNSPSLYPIKHESKALLRKAGERTLDGLWKLLAVWSTEFPSEKHHNYFIAFRAP